MSSRYFATLTAIVFSVMLFLPAKSLSQIIRSTGNYNEASSQLITPYSVFSTSNLQVTNTNDTVGVWIHVQIFRSYDADNDTDGQDLVICDERNFVDFLTPNDTHVYALETENFTKNIGETETDPGESTTIDLDEPQTTLGFILITPVVSESDFTAISFQHLIGNWEGNRSSWLNLMGRDAVDMITGEVLPDGTPLDGVTGGFVVLQPAEVIAHLPDDTSVDYRGISFIDVYGPPGLLGYNVTPGEVTFTSFIFDFKEDATSCGDKVLSCFFNIGIEDNNFTLNEFTLGEDYLCAGVEIPETQDNMSGTGERPTWIRTFVSGYDTFENVLAETSMSLSNPTGDSETWLDTK